MEVNRNLREDGSSGRRFRQHSLAIRFMSGGDSPVTLFPWSFSENQRRMVRLADAYCNFPLGFAEDRWRFRLWDVLSIEALRNPRGAGQNRLLVESPQTVRLSLEAVLLFPDCFAKRSRAPSPNTEFSVESPRNVRLIIRASFLFPDSFAKRCYDPTPLTSHARPYFLEA